MTRVTTATTRKKTGVKSTQTDADAVTAEIDYAKPYPGTAKDATLFGWCHTSQAATEVAQAIHAACIKSFIFYDKTVTCECGCHNAQEVTDEVVAV